MGGGGGTNGLVPEGREPVAANFINSTLRVITPELLHDDGRADRQGPQLQRRRSRRRPARDDRQRAPRRGRVPRPGSDRQADQLLRGWAERLQDHHRRRRRHPIARAGRRAAARVLPADRAGRPTSRGAGTARCTSLVRTTGRSVRARPAAERGGRAASIAICRSSTCGRWSSGSRVRWRRRGSTRCC